MERVKTRDPFFWETKEGIPGVEQVGGARRSGATPPRARRLAWQGQARAAPLPKVGGIAPPLGVLMPSASYFITLIALTVIMEARSQPAAGQEMVARVVVNRMEGSGVDAESVLYQHRQFSVWADRDLRLRVLRCAAAGRFPDDPWCAGIPGSVGSVDYWRGIYEVVWEVYHGRGGAPPPGMEGKLHFDNPAFWPDGLPPWMVNCVALGDHVFCD